MVIDRTPIERYRLAGQDVWVKREDLCSPFPGPSFSKMRGVLAHMRQRQESVIGVLDTYHSKAGWAVSYAAQLLGKHVVNYWPQYTHDKPGEIRRQQTYARALGAELISVGAGRSAILYHRACRDLRQRYPGAYMMPNALKLRESVSENAAEALRSLRDLPVEGTFVVSISSGTVAAGVLRGLAEGERLEAYDVVLHMGYSRPFAACRQYIEGSAGIYLPGSVRIIDEGYGYADAVRSAAPFPCNPYYDRKAWAWLETEMPTLRQPIVFWNIGD